jgi:hypothetical protein
MVRVLRSRAVIASAVMAGALALFATGSVVFANNGAPIHSCVADSNGSLRIVQAEDECRRSETPLSWNQSGPAGEPGADGQDGVSGRTRIVFEEQFSLSSGPVFQVLVSCPFGQVVVGGGGSTSSDLVVMVASVPLADSVTWLVRFRDLSGGGFGTLNIRAHAICVDAN